MITRGQMALATNQHGYDVISAENERISVKTVTTSNHVSFRKSTSQYVDRVIVLRLNVEDGEASIEELLDCLSGQLHAHVVESPSELIYRLRQTRREPIALDHLAVVSEATFKGHRIVQYENGSIRIDADGQAVSPAKPVLRTIAAELGVSIINSTGGMRNTRQLGAEALARLQQKPASMDDAANS